MAGTTEVLTIALLVVPLVLLGRNQLPSRARFIPLALMLLAIAFRARAFWVADATDAQVVGWLPDGVEGAAALVHMFDGPAGMMLALLFGFSLGMVRLERGEATHWAALCWVLLLGWGTPSDGFANLALSNLSNLPADSDWRPWAMPLVGLGISGLVIPTLVRYQTATPLQNSAALTVAFVAYDLGVEGVPLMLFGLLGHRLVSMHIHALRGAATRRRWMGLMQTFFHGAIVMILGTAFLANDGEIEQAFWMTRHAVGFAILCGLIGSLLPTLGFDARPRPEVWGFLSGLLIAPALLPGITLIEHAMLPAILLGVTMPVLATHFEFRPHLNWHHRGIESLFLIAIQVGVILLFKPFMLLGIIALPLLLEKSSSAEEEE